MNAQPRRPNSADWLLVSVVMTLLLGIFFGLFLLMPTLAKGVGL